MYELWTWLQQHFTQNDFFSGTLLTSIAIAVLAYFRKVPGLVWQFCVNKLTTVVALHSSDPLYESVQEWFSKENFDWQRRGYQVVGQYQSRQISGREEAPTYLYAPDRGTYFARIRGRFLWVWVSRDENGGNGNSSYDGKIKEYLCFQYWGRSKKFADLILEEARALYTKRHLNNLALYMPHGDYWRFHSNIVPRSAESVVLPNEKLENLHADIARFLASADEYDRLGVPYKRNYLLSGPPGTGKTSLIQYVASAFERDVYYLDLQSDGRNSNTMRMLHLIPCSTILVLEDFDCLFNAVATSDESQRSSDLSTLLNVLDGIASKRGVITILTTNHPERLEKALLRPGRVDIHIKLNTCTKEQAERMFLRFFPTETELAKEFATHVPEGYISPAELQGYLNQHRSSAEATLIRTNLGNLLYDKGQRLLAANHTDEQSCSNSPSLKLLA